MLVRTAERACVTGTKVLHLPSHARLGGDKACGQFNAMSALPKAFTWNFAIAHRRSAPSIDLAASYRLLACVVSPKATGKATRD